MDENTLQIIIEPPDDDGGADITHFQIVIQPENCGIETWQECKTISDANGGTWNTPTSWNDRPKGCWRHTFPDMNFYFNKNIDDGTLCRKDNDDRSGKPGNDYDQCTLFSKYCDLGTSGKKADLLKRLLDSIDSADNTP